MACCGDSRLWLCSCDAVFTIRQSREISASFQVGASSHVTLGNFILLRPRTLFVLSQKRKWSDFMICEDLFKFSLTVNPNSWLSEYTKRLHVSDLLG